MFYKWISRAGLALGLACSCVSAAVAAQTTTADTAPLQSVIIGPAAPSPVTRFIAAAWADAPENGAAEAAVRAAEARAASASRSLYNPELSFETEQTDIDTRTVGLSRTIDLGGKRRLRKQAARLEVQAAESDFVAARQQFSVDLLDTLGQYHTARALHQLAVRRTGLMERFAEAAGKRLAAGDIGPPDESLAKVAYANARIARAGAETSLARAIAELRAVAGNSHETWPELPEALPGVSPDFPLEAVVDRLPSLVALTARSGAQEVSARQANRERIPDPTFSLTGGKEGQEDLIGLSVSFPIPVRSAFRTDAQAMAQEAVQARQEVLREKRTATARIESALVAYRVTREAWEVWLESGQDSLAEQVTLLERLWKAGDISASDYLLQAGQNVDTQAAATALAGEVWSAALELLHATGSLDMWLMAQGPLAPPVSR